MKFPLRLLPAAWFAAFLAVACALPAHAAGLPALGDAGQITLAEERTLGDLVARDLYRDPVHLDDPVLEEYVDSIWQRLLAAATARGELAPELAQRFAWHVVLIRDAGINAFALPGGYFGINLGLIGVVESADELAAVLAHEMSHVTQRHIARMLEQQKRQTPLLVATMVLGAIATSRSPEAGAALVTGGQAALVQQQLNFSRGMEREADRIGYAVVLQAGFDARGPMDMFRKLQAAARLDDNGAWPYLRSHPLTSQRIADMQQRQQQVPASSERRPDLQAMLMAARARVLARPGAPMLTQWARRPDMSGFDEHTLAERAGALYAAALAQAELGDGSAARALAQRLAQLVATDAEAARQARLLQAELALRRGAAHDALALLEPAGADGAPAARASTSGRATLLLTARAQTAAGASAAAIDLLKPWASTHAHDAPAWQALAAALRADGRPLAALRAEGEAQMARLDYAGAVDRWRAAQDHAARHAGGAADRIEASIVDARLRVAREALHQQRSDEEQWN